MSFETLLNTFGDSIFIQPVDQYFMNDLEASCNYSTASEDESHDISLQDENKMIGNDLIFEFNDGVQNEKSKGIEKLKIKSLLKCDNINSDIYNLKARTARNIMEVIYQTQYMNMVNSNVNYHMKESFVPKAK